MNLSALKQLKSELVEVDIYLVEPPQEKVSSEIDEMWSYVEKKSNPRWLWHAIDHKTGQVLAYVFGQRKDEVFLELKELLQPFGISRFYTDSWGAYSRHLEKQKGSASNERGIGRVERISHLQLIYAMPFVRSS